MIQWGHSIQSELIFLQRETVIGSLLVLNSQPTKCLKLRVSCSLKFQMALLSVFLAYHRCHYRANNLTSDMWN